MDIINVEYGHTLAHLPSEDEDAGVGIVERDEGRGRHVSRRRSHRPGCQGLSGEQVQLSFTAAVEEINHYNSFRARQTLTVPILLYL